MPPADRDDDPTFRNPVPAPPVESEPTWRERDDTPAAGNDATQRLSPAAPVPPADTDDATQRLPQPAEEDATQKLAPNTNDDPTFRLAPPTGDDPTFKNSPPATVAKQVEPAQMVDHPATSSKTPNPPSAEKTLIQSVPPLQAGVAAPQEPGSEVAGPDAVVARRKFGDYEIIEEIARGGMGIVFRARQQSLAREVALKMILDGQLADAVAVQRFRAEAEAAAHLDHANIVPIYEVGACEGQHFFTMKLVEGGNLHGWLRTYGYRANKAPAAQPTPQAAARFVAALARAVHHAHQRGILHRDLKPGNILVHSEPPGLANLDLLTPVITDFGLAKILQGEQLVTQPGTIVGTPSYMAPEQATGEQAISVAADIFSLGAILFELLTGRPPFRGATPMETMRQLLDDEPPAPCSLRPELARDLQTICLQCLEKKPERRYASAQALAEDLQSWLRGEPIKARPVGKLERLGMWCRRKPALAALSGLALVGVLAALVLAGLLAANRSQALRDARANEQNLQAINKKLAGVNENLGTALAGQREALHKATLLAFQRGLDLCEEGDVARGLLWLSHAAELDHGDLRPIILGNLACWGNQCCPPGAVLPQVGRDFFTPRFSPDGQLFLACPRDQDRQLLTINLAAGGPVGAGPLALPARLRHAAISQDNCYVLTVSRGEEEGAKSNVLVWDLHTRQVVGRPLTDFPGEIDAEFSQDGKTFVTVSHHQGHVVELWKTATGARLAVLTRTSPEQPVNTLFGNAGKGPGGQILAVQGVEVKDKAPPPLLVFHGATGKELWRGQAGEAVVALAPGNRLMSRTKEGSFRLLETGTGKEWAVLDPGVEPAFSPEGRWLVQAGKVVRFLDAATGQPVQDLLPTIKASSMLGFSPDGQVLWSDGDAGITFFDLAKGRLLNDAPLADVHPTELLFGKDGLLITTDQGGRAQLWQLHPRLTKVSGNWRTRGLQLHPDGRTLLVKQTDRSFLVDGKTGQPFGAPFQHAEDCQVEFSPNGTALLVVDAFTRWWQIDVGRLASNRPAPHQRLSHPGAAVMRFSPDQQQLLTASLDGTVRIWATANGKEAGPPLQHPGPVQAATFTPDGKQVVILSVPGKKDAPFQLHRWNLADRQLLGSWPVNSPPAEAMLSPGGDYLFMNPLVEDQAAEGPPAKLWDARTGQAVGLDLGSRPWWALFGPLGDQLLTVARADQDGKNLVSLWNLAGQSRLGEPLPINNLLAAAFLKKGGPCVVHHVEEPGTWAALVEVPTGKIKARLDYEPGASQGVWVPPIIKDLNSIAIDPEGRVLVKAAPAGGMVNWDLGKPGQTARWHAGLKFYSLQFDPQGGLLLARADHRQSPRGQENTIERIDLVAVLDAKTGQFMMPPVETSLRLAPRGLTVGNRARVSRDQRYLAAWAADHDGVNLFRLPGGEPLLAAPRTWAEALTGMELDPVGRPAALDPEAWRQRLEQWRATRR